MKIYKQLRVCVKGFQKIVEKNKLKKPTKRKLQLAHKYIIYRDWCFFLGTDTLPPPASNGSQQRT